MVSEDSQSTFRLDDFLSTDGDIEASLSIDESGDPVA